MMVLLNALDGIGLSRSHPLAAFISFVLGYVGRGLVSLSYALNASTCWLYAKRLAPKHCSNSAACVLDGLNGIRCATLRTTMTTHPFKCRPLIPLVYYRRKPRRTGAKSLGVPSPPPASCDAEAPDAPPTPRRDREESSTTMPGEEADGTPGKPPAGTPGSAEAGAPPREPAGRVPGSLPPGA